MNVAIILAGGTGTRVGANLPKQFIQVNGKPILAYTLEIFQKNKNIDFIEIVCPEIGWVRWRGYVLNIPLQKNAGCVLGEMSFKNLQ